MQELIGKPMLWRTATYGDIAVHVAKLSPNGVVANLTIDGGPGATPCQRFPELADGIGFAIVGQLHKRPTAPRSRKAQPSKVLARTLPSAKRETEVTF